MKPPDESRATRASLLIKLRQHDDQAAWGEFVEIYVPLIFAHARNHGLQDADAADVAQDVMASVNSAISNFDYDPRQGKFRSYLYTVTRHQIAKFWRKNAGKAGTGNTAIQHLLEQVEAKDSDEELWNQQHRWRLFEWAASRVREEFSEKTWQAFELTGLEHKSPTIAAANLGMSVGAVYIAKSRVLKRIREVIHESELDV